MVRGDRRGQGTMEYLLVLIIILLAIIVGSKTIKTAISKDVFDAAKGRITKAVNELNKAP